MRGSRFQIPPTHHGAHGLMYRHSAVSLVSPHKSFIWCLLSNHCMICPEASFNSSLQSLLLQLNLNDWMGESTADGERSWGHPGGPEEEVACTVQVQRNVKPQDKTSDFWTLGKARK